MIVGVLQLELSITDAMSLKDKRRVVKSIKDRIAHRHFKQTAGRLNGVALLDAKVAAEDDGTDRVFFELPEDVAPKVNIPIYLCTAHYYLSDITEELCPTYVIPGSHKSGRTLNGNKDPEPKWDDRSLEPVICRAGDVLFFRSDVWHSGSLNATEDQTRYLLQVHYSHRFIAQQFSPYITWQFNPEVIAACNPRQLRLLGDHRQGAYD